MDIHVSRNYNIAKLQKWLDYELSSSVLLVLWYFLGFGILGTIFLAALFIAAILFIPLLLKVLWQERRIGWFIFFLIMVVGIPAAAYQMLEGISAGFIAPLIAIGSFYFYCATLKLAISSWFHDDEPTFYDNLGKERIHKR